MSLLLRLIVMIAMLFLPACGRKGDPRPTPKVPDDRFGNAVLMTAHTSLSYRFEPPT